MRLSWKSRTAAAAMVFVMALSGRAEMQAPELWEPVGVEMDTAQAYVGCLTNIAVQEAAVVPKLDELYFSVDGVVDEVHAVIGQRVSKGDVLITLNQSALDDQIEALEDQIERIALLGAYDDEIGAIDLEILRAELQMLMKQVPQDADAVALKQLDIEELELVIAYESKKRDMQLARLEEELAQLRQQRQENILYAPCDGTIVHSAELMKGSRVRAYAPVMYLADESRLTVETDYISMNIIDSSHDLYALVGDCRYEIEPVPIDEADYASGMLAGEKMKMQFEIVNQDDKLRAGMYAAVCLERNYIEDALLIPSNALYLDGSGSYVYVVDGDERVRRNVTRGQSNDWLIQIKAGLAEGEIVYVKE